MKISSTYIAALLSVMLLSATAAEARSSLGGQAELTYTDYNAKWDSSVSGDPAGGKGSFSGHSLTQKYSVMWNNTNLYSKLQPRYYNISLGYDLFSFDTNIKDGAQVSKLGDTFGKFRYSGSVGYNPMDVPIKFNAYINDSDLPTFKSGVTNSGLINDQLTYSLDGKMKSTFSGATLEFDPESARSQAIYGLPRFYVDYRENANKSLGGNYNVVDNKMRELAVAGLNKQNNWLQYKSSKYEDYIAPANNFTSQQIQIGLVDNTGRRKWASLTNWIEVSADGALTTKHATESTEEYDVNFMAIASRRTWEARTFMNYNRSTTVYGEFDSTMVERARLPLYIKGVYGADTNWYLNLSTERGRQVKFGFQQSRQAEYANVLTVGGTMFTRSSFNLSPSLSVTSSKIFGGADTYDVAAAVETNSTARFSNRLALAARNSFSYKDDGYNLPTSKTWISNTNLRAAYRDLKYSVALRQEMEFGEALRSTQPELGFYWKTLSTADAAWTPIAEFSTALSTSYDRQKYTDDVEKTNFIIEHRLNYDKQVTLVSFDSKYVSQANGTQQNSSLSTSGTLQYRPDRYNDAYLRMLYERNKSDVASQGKFELSQKYTYNFFSRSGVLRNVATLWQQFDYTGYSYGYGASRTFTQSLALGGRYHPTEKLSLYGSGTYMNTNNASVTFLYNAGLSANFLLFSSSLDYSYAKRDVDNRLEKKLMATVKRVF